MREHLPDDWDQGMQDCHSCGTRHHVTEPCPEPDERATPTALFGPAQSMRWALRALKHDPAAQERHAEFYDAVRQVYADGGALDDDALERLAALHQVPDDLAVRLRSRTHRCGWDLADAPTGAALLDQVRTEALRQSAKPSQAPIYTSYQGRRRSRTGD